MALVSGIWGRVSPFIHHTQLLLLNQAMIVQSSYHIHPFRHTLSTFPLLGRSTDTVQCDDPGFWIPIDA